MDQIEMLYRQWTEFLKQWYITKERKWLELAIAAEKRLVAINQILGNGPTK